MATITDTYPIFENGQALTSTHLNDMFEYLEEQERLTRIKLIGSGIVCGLDIRLERNPTTVVITNGAGLTSWGFLINFSEADNTGTVATEVRYPFFTVYTDPTEEIYPRFLKNSTQIPLYELQEIKIKDADPLDELPLAITDYGVILYLECLDKTLKNCIENDCDDKGIERIFTLRKLLVSKENIRAIICAETTQNVPKTEADLENLIHSRFQDKGLNPPRLVLGNKEITTATQLQSEYFILINQFLLTLQPTLQRSIANFAPILNRTPPTDLSSNLLSYLAKIKSLAIKEICMAQYVYDFLCDLALAHNEFIAAAFDLMTDCCSDTNRFPKHLRLGHLTDNLTCKPSIYRHEFTYAPILNQQSQLKDIVTRLYDKLILMLQNFQNTSTVRGIRITPSMVLHKPLSEQAIPFYYKYDSSLLKNWNPELGRRCREKEIFSYYANQYGELDYVKNPLDYSIFPYDFFRIEGHLCQDYRVVLRELLNLRRTKNLPFDVITLKIGTNGSNASVDLADCQFNDLEVICEAWKKELACLLKDTMRQMTDYKVPDLFVADSPIVVTTPIGSTTFTHQPIVEIILGDINMDAGSMGSFISTAYEPTIQDPCVIKDNGLSLIKEQYAAVAAMPQDAFEIMIEGPMILATEMIGFARIVDENCDSLDIPAIEQAQKKLLKQARKYTANIRKYKPGQTAFNFDLDAMARITAVLISVCTVEQLKVLKAEIERRKAEIQKMNLFHEYIKKNPGFDHRAGVPKGGTFMVVYGGESETDFKDKVIADFYLPYLCCSDCPPVTYIFEDKEPPVVVDLTIDGEINFYCTDDEREYEFKITPLDGKVEGEGVMKSGDKYVFIPVRVDLNGNDQKNINFTVNGKPVALSIEVIQKPTLDFDYNIAWKFDASGKRIPVLILENKGYKELYLYTWQIKEKTLNGSINTANPIEIPLQGEEPGNPISIAVTAQYPDVCQASNVERKEVPEDGQLVDIKFQVIGSSRAGGEEREIPASSNNVYSLNNTEIITLKIKTTPIGIFEIDRTYEFLQAQVLNPESRNSHTIFFKTQQKEGTHKLKYKVGGQSEEITLIIRNNDGRINRPFLSLAEDNFNNLSILTEDIRFRELIGIDNEVLKITTDLSKQLVTQISDPQKFTALREGQQDEKINESITQASDLVIKLIKSEGTTLNAKIKQALLFSLYKEQVGIALIVIIIIKADLNQRHVFSKLITKFINQIKDLKRAKINLETLIETVAIAQDHLVNKPKAKERFISFMEAIKKVE